MRSLPLARNSAIVSGFIGLAVLSGFAFDLLIAARFGLGMATDAYFAAVTLPVIILTAILLSSQSVLVVSLTGQSPDGGEGESGGVDRLFSTLLTMAVCSGLLLGALGVVLSPVFMRLLAPGFDTPTFALAVRLSQILFCRLPAALAAEVIRPALLARRRFAAASGGYFISSLSILLGFLANPAGDIRWAAWSVTLGAWVGLAWVALVFFMSHRGTYQPLFAWRDAQVRQVGRALTAPLLGLVLRQGVILAERWFGSFLGPGTVAALGYANKIIQSLAGIVFDGTAAASLPFLAKAFASGNVTEAYRESRRVFLLNTLTALLLGLGLAALSQQLANFLTINRSTGTLAVAPVAALLAVYSLALIPLGPFRAQQSLLYAARRYKWVGGLLVLASITTILLDWSMVLIAGAPGLGISFGLGLLIALAIGFTLIYTHRTSLVLSPENPIALRE